MFPEPDRRSLVEAHLEERRKRLTEEQLSRLLDTRDRPEAALPLYVLVAAEELCLFGDSEALSERIKRLPATVGELFAQALERLDHDHGRELTEPVCRWLAVSRSGMLESEVLDLLGGGGAEFPKARWTRLYRALELYLRPVEETTGAGLLDFYHEELRHAAYRRYLSMTSPAAEPTESYRSAHQELALYFRDVAHDDSLPRQWRRDRPRGLSELPYHQGGAQVAMFLAPTAITAIAFNPASKRGVVGTADGRVMLLSIEQLV